MLGHVEAVPFDGMHRHEVLLTILQSLLGMILLLNMRYSTGEAVVLFVLWLVQFLFPHSREAMIYVYGGLIAGGIVEILLGRRTVEALPDFAANIRTHVLRQPPRK